MGLWTLIRFAMKTTSQAKVLTLIVRTGSLGELEKNPVTIALWKGLLVVKVMRNLKDVLRAFQGRRQAFLTSVWCVF